jgi:hypothetical protein
MMVFYTDAAYGELLNFVKTDTRQTPETRHEQVRRIERVRDAVIMKLQKDVVIG